ncbi:MAG: hypothetical protein JSW70_09820 [Syntrophobacterales bacterium]|nr:MAG: hypothetical protein JSW70_09820 [Syntrophobacterales bacterium]
MLFGGDGIFPSSPSSLTSDSHVVRVKLRRDIQKKDIKVRLLEGRVLEIEWLRRLKGEDIPVE